MKDYSKFFEYPEVFITNIEHTNDKIKPTFRDDTTEYPLTKENIEKIYKRLELQYLKVIQNMDKVIKSKKTVPLVIICFLLLGASYLGYSYNLETVSMILGTSGILSFASAVVTETIGKNHHKEQLCIYKDFLEHIDEFSKAIEKDPNILCISKGSSKILEQEKILCSKEMINDPININFMDKAKLEDLKMMSKRLKMYYELELPVIFIGEKENAEVVKTRTKNK